MARQMRRWGEWIASGTIAVLAILSLIALLPDQARSSLPGPVLSTALLAAIGVFLVSVVGPRIVEAADGISEVKGIVEPDVSIHRDTVYQQSIGLLTKLSDRERPLPIRAYVPAGAWVADEAKTRWFKDIAELVRSGRVTFTGVYGTPDPLSESARSDFAAFGALLRESFAPVEDESVREKRPKAEHFYLQCPSRSLPSVAMLLAGDLAAELGFPVTRGYGGLERGIVVSGRVAVDPLIDWFDQVVLNEAELINKDHTIAEGLSRFEASHYRD